MEGEKGRHPEEVQKADYIASLKILGRKMALMHYERPLQRNVDERGGRQEGAGEASETGGLHSPR